MKGKQSTQASREERRRSFGIGGAGNIRTVSLACSGCRSIPVPTGGSLLTGPSNRHKSRGSRQRRAPVRALGAAEAEQCPEQGVVFHVEFGKLERREGAFPHQVQQKLMRLGLFLNNTTVQDRSNWRQRRENMFLALFNSPGILTGCH